MKTSFKKTLALPFGLWFLFYMASLVFGFTPYPNVLQAPSTFATPMLIALFFGLWIGMESYGNFSFGRTIGYAFIISFIIGMVQLFVTELLINFSPTFLDYTTYIYTQGITAAPILSEAVGIWFAIMIATLVASAVGFTGVAKIKGK